MARTGRAAGEPPVYTALERPDEIGSLRALCAREWLMPYTVSRSSYKR